MNDEQLQAIKERYTRDYGELPTAARADVPALVAEVERLRAQLDAVPVDSLEFAAYYRDPTGAHMDAVREWLESISGGAE